MLNQRRVLLRDDSGQALVIVLVVSLLCLGAVSIALTSAIGSLSLSTRYGNSSQSLLASRSGLDSELAAIRNTASVAGLPCANTGSLSVVGATSAFSVTVQYFAGGASIRGWGAVSTLGGTTPPTTATLVSTGTAPGSSQAVTMQETLSIATASAVSQALSYAIFTSSTLNLENAATINKTGASGPSPALYTGQALNCADGTATQGSVTSYGPASISANCSFAGNVVSAGTVTMGNSANVGGNVTAYGGGIAMTGNVSIGGNATATAGGISLTGSSSIAGNADGSSTITTAGSSTIAGKTTPFDGALASQVMPAAITFPPLNPTVASWQATGWTVVQVPSGTYPTCASYFQNQSSGATDPFMSQLMSAVGKIVIDAPTCAVDYSSAHSFYVDADTILEVQSLTLQNSNAFCAEASAGSMTCSSSTSRVHSLSILASPAEACTSNLQVNFADYFSFANNLSTFVYTPGQVSFANAPYINGQVLACGGFIGANSFTMTFDPTASGELAWTGAVQGITVTVLSKLVLRG
jgi:cytoskeletal protein CcmA (bactofilin family)